MTDTLWSLGPLGSGKTHILGQLLQAASSTDPTTLVITAGTSPLHGHAHLDEPDGIAAALAALHDEMTARYLHRRAQRTTGTSVLVILDPAVVSDGTDTVRRLAGDLFRLGMPVGVTVILAADDAAVTARNIDTRCARGDLVLFSERLPAFLATTGLQVIE